MQGFIRVAAAVPKVKVADVPANVDEIVSLAKEAEEAEVAIVVFPELCLSSYSCADLFFQEALHNALYKGLMDLLERTSALQTALIVGAPLWHENRLYNCALVLQRGKVLGVVPKSYLANHKEFYEKRWFQSGKEIVNKTIHIVGEDVPFGVDLLFNKKVRFGIEICEDLWSIIPPSSQQAINSAVLLFNLSASNALVSKASYRRELVGHQSARTVSAYIYTSAGVHESTTDLIYSGAALIAENGTILAENPRFQRESGLITADVDVEKLHYYRIVETSYADTKMSSFRIVPTFPLREITSIKREIDPLPFVPKRKELQREVCEEIFMMQSSALAKRIEFIGKTRPVVGISGGLDSTLALLVAVKAMHLLGRENSDIVAVTMPGFGTTSRTYQNAVKLCELLGVTFEEIDIKASVMQHFEDIGHDPHIHDIVYENAQARERTQILFDMANKVGGIVIGTGDLSEIALGFATYGGDHLSMYGVNASIPKTLVRYIIDFVAKDEDPVIAEILEDIIDTPVSPELLPKEDDKIVQKTEEIVGPYELHDFFLYHFVKYGAAPLKILVLAQIAFEGKYEKEIIKKWLIIFLKRFFANQFKRSAMPDSVKVGSIALSPRGDWRMPSDAEVNIWLKELKNA
jgi:NAD+ synthase (glutamine-hydrolysing)